MEIVVSTFRVLAYVVVGAAGIELLLALFSIRVRRYIVQHPKAHLIFFAGALFLSLFLVPAPSHRDGRTDAISPRGARRTAATLICST